MGLFNKKIVETGPSVYFVFFRRFAVKMFCSNNLCQTNHYLVNAFIRITILFKHIAMWLLFK